MKNYAITCLIFALIVCTNSYRNTTLFWQKTLNLTDPIHYQSYTGYQQIDWYYTKGTSGMYYSLFGAMGHNVMEQLSQTPLIVWLQGGPGSGSQFGAFTQIGPVKIVDGKPQGSHAPWNIFGHLLFIDSPLNAGFSFQGERQGAKQVSSTTEATSHLLNFMYNFYKQFPSLKKSKLYITGQSFAGHYIPNLASKIIRNQTFFNQTGVKLGGIAIGNGWTDPVNQVNFYDSFLWSVGIIGNKFRDTCAWYQTNSMINIYETNYQNATDYFNFLSDNKTTPEVYFGNISMFNFRNYDGIDRSFVQFLNNNKNQFGALQDYLSGNQQIYTAFGPDISRSYAADVATVLNNVPVLIYNGQNDVVVNTAGVLQYLNTLRWSQIKNWKKAKKQIWTRYGQVQGWAKVYGNLWFVLVNGAGHMVPTDQPESAFSMMGHFMTDHRDWKN